MRSAKEFIIFTLKNITDKVMGIALRYAYDEDANFHIIEVSPESIRRNDKEYMEMEYNLWKEFHKLYPDEDILISESDKTNNMDNSLYECAIAHNQISQLYQYKKVKENNCFEEWDYYQLAA